MVQVLSQATDKLELTNSMKRKFQIAKITSIYSNARPSRKVGAALFSGSILLSIGYNEYKTTHPSSAVHCNIHAEHRCIIRRRHYDKKSNLTMYTYRETADGKPACSKPCTNCIRLLKEAGIESIYYLDMNGSPQRYRI